MADRKTPGSCYNSDVMERPTRYQHESEVSFIIPAHNEAETVRQVAMACTEATSAFRSAEVIAVIDSSTDESSKEAVRGGARVIERNALRASKAASLQLGVAESTGEYLYFVDADLVGLKSSHLLQIARPVLARAALMGVGTFDYRCGAGLVQRVPWSTGQRVLPREVFEELPVDRLSGYNIELLINEAIGRRGGITASTVMRGVTQRSKTTKYGRSAGIRANLRMWCEIAGSVDSIQFDHYRRFAKNVHLASGTHCLEMRRQSSIVTSGAALAMLGLAKFLAIVGQHGNSDTTHR